ncbi:hypothetical protein PPEP_b0903 [Pseudoalteromonas peptidolytica F12-50-A1]|uniref:Uncharacterized protein n=1 Tax=Pseudoalteromonas peptidolytica F12-50-A1 TaxID=1315280 RepID=A0A8I0N168_9GAMM|nr:hypothetical protein [Pseudoalteromonas peptidolytica F12-50-A1]
MKQNTTNPDDGDDVSRLPQARGLKLYKLYQAALVFASRLPQARGLKHLT